jgi:alpha-methylacyl-CoA racemase
MGPLAGTKVIEVAGIGPGPFCGMMLADMGAEVTRIDRVERVGAGGRRGADVLARGRRNVSVDLKQPEGVELVLRLVEQADVIFEGFRPGVMERLGLGPDVCLQRNPQIIYGRMTGWGQEGPLSQAAGHDINYIALTGALHAIGPRGGAPTPPLNLVGDFGGGGMYLAYGIACALIERTRSGKGQVVDASMIDGASLLMASFHGARAMGGMVDERGSNTLDGGAPHYHTYETSDGKWISLGSLEPQFYAELLRLTDLDGEKLPAQNDHDAWPEMQERFAAIFSQKTRDEWCAIMEGTDVCFAPVLTIGEAYQHPHNQAHGTFVEVEGIKQPAPGPRMSRTPGMVGGPSSPGQHTDSALRDYGVSDEEIEKLRAAGAVA